MTLAETKKGSKYTINSVPRGDVRSKGIRLGIGAGAEVECSQKIPGGPIIIKKNFQEIAISRNLAQKIKVENGGQ